jgi:streptomycin 6-kinase
MSGSSSGVESPQARLDACLDAWGLVVDHVVETSTSLVANGHRLGEPVVLKVIRAAGDEWHAGAILEAFGGRGVVRVLEHTDGAVLMERAMPGTSLAAAIHDDDEATVIIADVIGRMSPAPPPAAAQPVAGLAASFDRYLSSSSRAISEALVRQAQHTYLALCESQGPTQLLHGDLHHGNILLDHHRGWLAIDPKGLVGERAYEVGAPLRNPVSRPECSLAPGATERRARQLSGSLGLDCERVLGWTFAQAVLAALWELEDDGRLTAGVHWVELANAIDRRLVR